ncbi:hypothetical protein RJ641_026625 [Dillenia turbinata]|uniref:Uncharacterized protein n=1 Tax=Dillenia turbinata TaxID=194707 RepID=A0AAN8W7A0_9MAGN
MQISPSDYPESSPGKEQQGAGVGILLQIMKLVLSFVLGHVFSSGHGIAGLIVGGLANEQKPQGKSRQRRIYNEKDFRGFEVASSYGGV